MTLGAATITAVGWAPWPRELPPPYTMANDEQWYATHKYGAPYLIFGGVATLAMSLAALPFAIAGALPDAFATGVLGAGAFVILVAALCSWFFGVKAAKAHLGQ